MQFWMSTVLSTAPGAAAPLVGVLSATAPQLVIEIELAGWEAAAGAFQRSIELIQNDAVLDESFCKLNVAPGGIAAPLMEAWNSSQKARGSPSAGFWSLP